eukprot:jgi/Chrzof1/4096/Cz13g20070.t1
MALTPLKMADSPEQTTPTGQGIKKKRTSGSIRRSHLTKGAFLIEFKTPAQPMDMLRRDVPIGIGPSTLFSGKERQSVVDQYRTMERKGLRVTKDTGCLIPDEQYGIYQQGATVKGHQRSFAFFANWCPKQGISAIRNEFGWPMNLQISHLCHRRSCCRIDHLVAEEQWRNLKRNYCGFNGQCDCGNTLKCLRRYQMQDQSDLPEFCQSKEEVRAALVGTPEYVIHNNNRHADRDKVAKQRQQSKKKRQRKTELHQFETERKAARLSGEKST